MCRYVCVFLWMVGLCGGRLCGGGLCGGLWVVGGGSVCCAAPFALCYYFFYLFKLVLVFNVSVSLLQARQNTFFFV